MAAFPSVSFFHDGIDVHCVQNNDFKPNVFSNAPINVKPAGGGGVGEGGA